MKRSISDSILPFVTGSSHSAFICLGKLAHDVLASTSKEFEEFKLQYEQEMKALQSRFDQDIAAVKHDRGRSIKALQFQKKKLEEALQRLEDEKMKVKLYRTKQIVDQLYFDSYRTLFNIVDSRDNDSASTTFGN